MRHKLAILSIIVLLPWCGLFALSHAWAGFTDGAPQPRARNEIRWEKAVEWGIYTYLALMLICSLPFIRGKVLLTIGLLAHLAFLSELITSYMVDAMVLALIVITFTPISYLWFNVYNSATQSKRSR